MLGKRGCACGHPGCTHEDEQDPQGQGYRYVSELLVNTHTNELIHWLSIFNMLITSLFLAEDVNVDKFVCYASSQVRSFHKELTIASNQSTCG